MAKSRNDNNWLTCPHCGGHGLVNGEKCNHCNSQGIGWLSAGWWFYAKWSDSLSLVQQKRLVKKLFLLFDLVIYLIVFSGWLFFAWRFGQETNWFSDLSRVVQISFWITPTEIIRYLVWTIVASLFLVYRLSRQVSKVKIPDFNQEVDDLIIGNWNNVKNLPPKQKVNVIEYLPETVIDKLGQATVIASSLKADLVSADHFFLALLDDSKVKQAFFRLGLEIKEIADKVKKNQAIGQAKKVIGLSTEVQTALIQGAATAWSSNEAPLITDFLAPAARNSQVAKEVVYEAGIKEDSLASMSEWLHINQRLAKQYRQIRDMAQFKPASNMDRAYTAVATPFLNQFAHDLTAAAKNNQLPLCVARHLELNQIIEAWSAGRMGVVLVGSEGVGKKSVVYGLAQLMVAENVPSFLQDKRLVEIDLASLLGGVAAEEAQNRLARILYEVNQAGNIILFINNLEKITGLTVGADGGLDLSDILAEALQRGAIRFLSATLTDNYRDQLARRSLGSALAKVNIEEPDEQQIMIIGESWASYWERLLGVMFTFGALATAKLASQRYASEPAQPARFLKVLEAAARQVVASSKDKIVNEEAVRAYASQAFGVPMQQVGQQESEMLLNLEATIHERLIGQEEAVDMVSASLRRARVELRDSKKPIANFLFLGPTGVGKTELAKTLAQVYFGDEEAMIRLDMSEYQQNDSVNKMIGGNGENGYLTEAVRQRPFSLILLDEIEKAHPDILNLFLQVFDDGRLTDAQGRTVDFSNAIIIATSNAGANYIREQVVAGTDLGIIRQSVLDNELTKVMRPELINRFDGVIVFRPLNISDMKAITGLQLKKMEQQLADKNIFFQVTEAGLMKIAEAGFDSEFGARPLKRLLQDTVSNQLAEALLAKKLKRRDTVLINDLGQVEIVSASAL